LSEAEPATLTHVVEVVAGAEESVMAGGVESKLRQRRRTDSSITRSSGASLAGTSLAEAAIAVCSSLAPPQPTMIIEAQA
jgi:hypothetical protein